MEEELLQGRFFLLFKLKSRNGHTSLYINLTCILEDDRLFYMPYGKEIPYM